MVEVSELESLKSAMLVATKAYMDHPSVSEKTTVEQDILGQKLLKDCGTARRAYEDALTKY